MRRVVVLIAAFVAFTSTAPVNAGVASIPTRPLEAQAPLSPPEVTAEAWLLWDDTFQRELGSLLPDDERAMASTTKMMTALVALEYADLDDRFTVSESAAGVGESEIDLVAGETWRMEDLLKALLLRSANDAAMTLAENIGGSEAGFVAIMNDEAEQMGLEHTHFMNPHGLDEPGHYSSARDLLTIARTAMEIPLFAELVGTRAATFPDSPSGQERSASSTNALLGTFDGAIGVKTGYTNNAGLTIVAAAERDGRRLYTVVMGSSDHFADAASLLRYGFTAFGLLNIVAEGEALGMERGPTGTADVVATADLDLFGSTEEEIELVIEYDEGGDRVVVAESGDQEVGRVPLSSPAPDPLPGIGEAFAWASAYWDWLWGND